MTVRPTRPARRMRRVTRSTSRSLTVSIASGDFGAQPSARWDPIEPRRRRGLTRRGSRLWASASCRPEPGRAGATSVSSGRLRCRRRSPIPSVSELVRRDRAHAPEPLDRQRVEELELAVRRNDQEAVRLGDAARHLREELRPRHADRDREADALADRDLATAPRSPRVARRAARSRERRGTPRRSTVPRRAASCPRTPR